MLIQDYVGNDEYAIICFSFLLIKKVNYKIQSKKLFYVDQVWRYVETRINSFLQQLSLDDVQNKLYKHQMLSLIETKISPTIAKHKLFHCVS